MSIFFKNFGPYSKLSYGLQIDQSHGENRLSHIISSFMLALFIRIAQDCFKLLIFYSEKFSTDVCRLPYAVNVNLNLSNVPVNR